MRARAVAVMITGICAWIVAGIIALLLNADSKIIWTCVVGAALGLVGIPYTVRRDRRTGI